LWFRGGRGSSARDAKVKYIHTAKSDEQRCAPVLSNPQQFRSLFKSEEEITTAFEVRLRALEKTAERHPETFFNTKDLFSPIIPIVKSYLSKKPWDMFLERWAEMIFFGTSLAWR
jgi:hypothetical protein